MNATPRLLKHNFVLVGAGNSHIQIVKKWAMTPIEGASLSLVNDGAIVPYSGMVPGCIAGRYTRQEVEIDLSRLCGLGGVRFVNAVVTGIDVEGQSIQLSDQPALSYTTASLNIGSLPFVPQIEGSPKFSIPVKPLGRLMDQIDAVETHLEQSPKTQFKLCIVGSGAGGIELTLALEHRFRRFNLAIHVVEAHQRLLPQYSESISKKFASILKNRGISTHLNERIEKATADELIFESGKALPFDAVIWATRATPPTLLQSGGFRLDKRGFLKVEDTLQTTTDRNLLATGDCISLASHPDLAKAGVYAVRQGPTLWANLNRIARERSLRPYRPQKRFLTVLNTSDGKAVACYAGSSIHSSTSFRLKDYIDRKWMRKFQDLEPLRLTMLKDNDNQPMRCGGCGSKIPSHLLQGVLAKLKSYQDPNLLVGPKEGEDASVFLPPASKLEVQSVDFFKAFINDPYLLGRVSAINALSDLYAMNATPRLAQAIVNIPYARGQIQTGVLTELLSGVCEELSKAKVSLAGGHTTESSELAIGLSITGYADKEDLFEKKALLPGQKLILTKPIGSGALLAAHMQGACHANWLEKLLHWMLTSNDKAAEIFADAGVSACTDITGFGLAGHLLEMLEASKQSARLVPDLIPIYKGFGEVTSLGIYSTLHTDNQLFASKVALPGDTSYLFDPQTSGGLLAGVDPSKAEDLIEKLSSSGFTRAAVIGEVVPAKGASEIC